jgi:hypothetical protein
MTETTMLDLLIEALDPLPAKIEETIWETGSQPFEEVDDSPLVESDKRIAAFYGSATEMAPSLAERGGWGLVLRRSEPRYLNIHHAVAGISKLNDHIDPVQGLSANASGLVRALLNLAGNPTIREIAAGSRLDPVAIGEMVRAVCSLLTAVDAPSGALGSKGSAAEWSDVGFSPQRMTADTTSLTDKSDSAQISADADRLADEFLSFPGSIETNSDVLSAVDALMERHTKPQPGDDDAWAEQLSENLSRFTD